MLTDSWLVAWICCQRLDNSDRLQLPNQVAIGSAKMASMNYRILMLISASEIGHCISQMCLLATSSGYSRRKLSVVEVSTAERLKDETGLRSYLTCRLSLLQRSEMTASSHCNSFHSHNQITLAPPSSFYSV